MKNPLNKELWNWLGILVGFFFCGVLLYLGYDQRDRIREEWELFCLDDQAKLGIIYPKITWVAHGGGEVQGLYKTNSHDSLNVNYSRGCRYFEIDFNWTKDDELVALHDWDHSLRDLFGHEAGRLSLKAFSQLKMTNGLSQMKLDDVMAWMEQHAESYLITDIKERNIEALALIASRYRLQQKQVIPQVYRISEYVKARELGFEQVILTLYLSRYSDDALLRFCRRADLFGMTMPYDRALTELPQRLNAMSVNTFVHAVPGDATMAELRLQGIDGVYAGTDRE